MAGGAAGGLGGVEESQPERLGQETSMDVRDLFLFEHVPALPPEPDGSSVPGGPMAGEGGLRIDVPSTRLRQPDLCPVYALNYPLLRGWSRDVPTAEEGFARD